jgi:hypothetical protein
MKLNKIKLIGFFQCLIVCLLFSQTFALNTLRSNQLIFSTGHKISDGVYEGVMTDPIPHNVCYENTNKEACETDFFTYYTSFADPKPGTINITIDGENKMLRAIVGPMDTTIVTAYNTASIAGFNTNDYRLNMKKSDGTDETRENSSVATADLLFTSFQIGKELYGESIWLYHHKEYNEMVFEPYRGMDWTLEPSSPIQFSINAMYKEGLTEDKNQALETYLTKHVRVKDIAGVGGQVCIDKTSTFNHCGDKIGLFIKGDVRLDKMFGFVGYSTTTLTDNNNTTLPNSDNEVEKIGTLTVSRDLSFTSKHTIAFFGYLSVDRIKGDDYHRYWMEEGSSCSLSRNTNKSTHGTFEYQDCCNKASSHTFLHVKKNSNAPYHTYSFCVQRSKKASSDSPTATFSFGLVGYALPESQ